MLLAGAVGLVDRELRAGGDVCFNFETTSPTYVRMMDGNGDGLDYFVGVKSFEFV